jgi:uncharacterized protein YdaU (DUF1376 family)
MSAKPWYRRYGGEFIVGTMALSLEEKGAYSLCLDLIYDLDGPIPDDARWLAGICGVSVRKWTALRERLINTGKLVEREGFLSNARADQEIENRAKTARKLAENGAKGGNKRAENAAATSENKDIAEAWLKPTRGLLEPEPEKKSSEAKASSPDRSLRSLVDPAKDREERDAQFERFRKAYPRRAGTDARPESRKAFDKATRSGADPEKLIAAAAKFAASEEGQRSAFVPMSATWLNKGRWSEFEPPAPVLIQPSSPPAAVSDEQWLIRLQMARERGRWFAEWGPPLGKAGSLVPARLVTEPLRRMFEDFRSEEAA